MLDQKKPPEIIQLDSRNPKPLQPGVIHLYVVSTNTMPHDELDLASVLNLEEQARASRFINIQHGQSFRQVRGLLRLLLSHYTNLAPEMIEFDYAKYGKPMLKGDTRLQFNLSHSRDMVVYAFGLDRELGVDIEYMRPQRDLAGMIGHVSSEKEQIELKALHENETMEAFYRLWTRKEAFIKACGRGLGMGLRSIHIGTGESHMPIAVTYKDEIQSDWFVQDMIAPVDYKMAISAKYSVAF